MKAAGLVFYGLAVAWATICGAIYVAFSSGKWSEGALRGALTFAIPVLPLFVIGWTLRYRAGRTPPELPSRGGQASTSATP